MFLIPDGILYQTFTELNDLIKKLNQVSKDSTMKINTEPTLENRQKIYLVFNQIYFNQTCFFWIDSLVSTVTVLIDLEIEIYECLLHKLLILELVDYLIDINSLLLLICYLILDNKAQKPFHCFWSKFMRRIS